MRVRFLQRPDVAVALGNLHELHRHDNDLGVGMVMSPITVVLLRYAQVVTQVEYNSQLLIVSMLMER